MASARTTSSAASTLLAGRAIGEAETTATTAVRMARSERRILIDEKDEGVS